MAGRDVERVGSRSLVMLAVGLATLAAACSRSSPVPEARVHERASHASLDPKTGTSASPRVIADGRPVPKGGGVYKIGSPYKVAGRWYVPKEDAHYDQRGIASWYGADFHGRKTANGEIFDMNALTAAHPTLPLPSYAYVTNLANGRTLLVRINDRGPYAHDRIIDLSRQTARALGLEQQGTGAVRVRFAGHAPLNGDDVRERQHLASQPWNGDPGRYTSVASTPAPYRSAPAAVAAPQQAYEPPSGWSVSSYRSGLTRGASTAR